MTEQKNNDTEWDKIVSSLRGNFLQSSAWGAFQHRLGREIVRQQNNNWAWQGMITMGRGVKYLNCPYGPTVKGNASESIGSLVAVGREHNLDFVRFEPIGSIQRSELLQNNAKEMRASQPKHTWALDLAQNEEELRLGLTSGHRNAINGAERRGLTFRSSDNPKDVDLFLTMLRATSKSSDFKPYPEDYYGVMFEALMPKRAAVLYLAESEGRAVASAIGFNFAGTRYYAHAASIPEARKLQAAVPLVWYMIMDAKQSGLTNFDFWGIAPADQPNHPWAGFSQFKRSFGGRQVDYLGTWEIPLKPLKYRLYALAKKVLT